MDEAHSAARPIGGLYDEPISDNEIRILGLVELADQSDSNRPESHPPSLRCTLRRTSFDTSSNADHDHPATGLPYDALSYVWQEESYSIRIRCNDQDTTVTGALYEALKQIWSDDPELWIWADALCINQLDPTEKGKQVAMMAKIYQAAQKVHGWLGRKMNLDAWGFLNQLTGMNQPASRVVLKNLSLKSIRRSKEGLTAIQRAFDDLNNRKWFYRAWTFQGPTLQGH